MKKEDIEKNIAQFIVLDVARRYSWVAWFAWIFKIIGTIMFIAWVAFFIYLGYIRAM